MGRLCIVRRIRSALSCVAVDQETLSRRRLAPPSHADEMFWHSTSNEYGGGPCGLIRATHATMWGSRYSSGCHPAICSIAQERIRAAIAAPFYTVSNPQATV